MNESVAINGHGCDGCYNHIVDDCWHYCKASGELEPAMNGIISMRFMEIDFTHLSHNIRPAWCPLKK